MQFRKDGEKTTHANDPCPRRSNHTANVRLRTLIDDEGGYLNKSIEGGCCRGKFIKRATAKDIKTKRVNNASICCSSIQNMILGSFGMIIKVVPKEE